MLDILKVHSKHYKSKGDYSVTTLLNPPRIVHLNKRHSDTISDPDTMFPSMIGTGVHAYIEQCLKQVEGYRVEQRLTHTIEDRIITGTFDILDSTNKITDIKTCKVWKTIFDPDMVEWHQQQNIYAYLLHLKGIEVTGIDIQAIYLDWIESKAQRDSGYPQQPDPVYKLDLWPYKQTEEFLVERIRLMKANEEVPDDELPLCAPEEMWEEPTKFACMKSKDAARAGRVLDNLNDAIRYMKNTKGFGDGSYVEIRYGRRKRCEKYCEVREFCNHYKSYQSRGVEIIPYEQV